MKSIYSLNKENREECINFLRANENHYTFAKFDKEEMEWQKDGEDVDVNDSAPFVTYYIDDIEEYVVTDIYLNQQGELMLTIVHPNHPASKYYTYEVEIMELYGASECYIYEKMMELKLVEREG